MVAIEMDDRLFEATMMKIIDALKKKGYEPYDQIIGYLETGESNYITRSDRARDMIQALDKTRIRRFIMTYHK